MGEWVAAIAGGIIGGLATYLLQTLTNLRSEDVAAINNHIADIDRIEAAAIEYWLHDAKKDPSRAKELAAVLNGCLAVSGCFNVSARELLSNRYGEYKRLDDELFDVATGGNFQVADRRPDLERVTGIMSVCHSMRMVLKQARKARFWAH